MVPCIRKQNTSKFLKKKKRFDTKNICLYVARINNQNIL